MPQRVEGLSIDLDLNTQGLNRGLKGAKDQLKTVNSEMKANMSAFDRADQSVEKYETRIEGLNKKLKAQEKVTSEARKEYDRMVEQHGEGSKEAEKAAKEYNNQASALNNLDRYVNNATEELEQLRQEQQRANSAFGKISSNLDSVSGHLDTASEKMSSFGDTMSASVTAPIVGMGALAVESTREFREQMARLETNAKNAGLGVDDLRGAMKELSGVSDETDSNVEALSNLMATDMNESQLQQTIDNLSGAIVKFPDTLKIESLADGLQETVATGKAIGPFAELLERMGVDLETFDEGLAESKESDDELNYTLNELNDLDLSKMNKEFRDSNKELVEHREAQYDFQESFAELGEKLEPIATDITERVIDIVEAFNELEPATQDNIIKFAGLAAAVGPASKVLGGLTGGVKGVIKQGGKLASVMGKKGGTGLLGSLGMLGKTGVAGLAVAGVGALGYGIYELVENSREAKEVNLDLAQSFSDQASNLQDNVETFENLTEKSKLSNDELARLNDLNKRISESSNPGEINELQKQYDNLARESGLSKDELNDLFKANKNIIDQSPDVKKKVSEQGNAFADTTDAVKEQIEELRNLSEVQLKGDRAKLLEQEEEARKEINKQTELLEKKEQRLAFLYENQDMSKSEIEKRVEEINDEIKEGNLTEEESWNLDQERTDILKIKRGEIAETVETLQDERKEIENTIDEEQQKIDELKATNQQLANIYLKNVDINKEGEKGLQALDESIAKNQKEIEQLQTKKEENGQLTQKEQDRLSNLKETTEEQELAKLKIFEELGIYKDINSLLETKLTTLSEEEQQKIINLGKTRDIKVEEGNILGQLQKKNQEYLEERENLEKNLQKQGANKTEINKQIEAIDRKILKNDQVIEDILKEAGLWDQVKDEINLGKNALDQQGEQIDQNNSKTEQGIQKEKERTKEASEDVDKNIGVSYWEKNSVWDLVPDTISVGIDMVGSALGFAKGTESHPGGTSWLGEEGTELVKHGNKWAMAGFGLYDVPKGAQVFTHNESKRILSALNNIPAYAGGVSPIGEADRIVSRINQQQSVPMQGEAVIYTTVINQMDSREISRYTFKSTEEFQNRDRRVKDKFRG
ncbi:hypothetical protein J416_09524 [Gracilibacillus halophilus YIM-C55.5]|uniref:Uncharacterized protein n=1 Tax=Gracilibacillus halophilus YIM-C55.5 TaxID=1308866 RepID=N4WKN4_9BACI|nr:hypothetical protein [Gracilibacillus halophilus]ENH96727.1 hypothetical protein J416_09524 [Gracilibacillus halophilus YIM-C55.5]